MVIQGRFLEGWLTKRARVSSIDKGFSNKKGIHGNHLKDYNKLNEDFDLSNPIDLRNILT